MDPEPLQATAPDHVRPVLLRQAWRDVAFLHWPLDPAIAAPLLPSGTEPDVLDGVTYAGVVALRFARTAPGRGPAVPYLGSFAEVNLRLYSVDRRGRRGIVFLRMDAGRLLPVLTARALLRLPYVWSRPRVRRDGARYEAAVDRRAGIALRIGAPVAAGPLELFLTARWRLHTRVAGRTVQVPLAHGPWSLHRAEITGLAGDPLGGLPPAGSPLGVLYSPGVDDVRLGPPSGVDR